MPVGQKSRGMEGHVWMTSVNEWQRGGSEQQWILMKDNKEVVSGWRM